MSAAPVHAVYLSDVEPERLTWLSRGRLAAGKLTVLDGDPGLGKSTLLAELPARVTRGDALPNGEAGRPRGVVLLSAEDGLADTIRPRLEAAGADLDRVLALVAMPDEGDEDGPGRLPTIPDDLGYVEELVRHADAALLVIDPLMAYLGADTNAHRDQDVRRALAALAALAERTGVAVVLIRHLNKAQSAHALYRGGGSIGIIGAARCGLLLAADPDDPERRVLAPTKANLARPPVTPVFRLAPVPGTDVARVAWLGETAHTAANLLAQPADEEERGLWPACGGADTPADEASAVGCARPASLPRPVSSDLGATTQDGVNLRQGPGTNCDVLAVLPLGTSVIARSGAVRANGRSWLLFEANGTEGWVAAEFVGPAAEAADELPSTEAPLLADPGGYSFPTYDVDCPELSYDHAQWILTQDPSDPYRLDADNDGIACEANASGDGGGYTGNQGSSDTASNPPVYTEFGGLDGVDYDCYDFGNDQAAAQAYFESDGGSIYNNADGLDRNHNGLACEPGEFD